MRRKIVTLITDFGTSDGYVGAMKGVILALAPTAQIVDVTHEVPAFDLSSAAFALAQAAPLFPDGTIHVVVVDPGVGSVRRSIVVDDGRQRFVGPDNGVFDLAVTRPLAVHEIANPAFHREPVCPTFHGRDVFAQAAGRLAAGAVVADAGPAVELTRRLATEPVNVEARGRRVVGHVIHIDSFGNLVTDIPVALLSPRARVVAGTMRVAAVSRTFADVPTGRPVAYVGSLRTLELGVREGSAARRYRLRRGSRVIVSS